MGANILLHTATSFLVQSAHEIPRQDIGDIAAEVNKKWINTTMRTSYKNYILKTDKSTKLDKQHNANELQELHSENWRHGTWTLDFINSVAENTCALDTAIDIVRSACQTRNTQTTYSGLKRMGLPCKIYLDT